MSQGFLRVILWVGLIQLGYGIYRVMDFLIFLMAEPNPLWSPFHVFMNLVLPTISGMLLVKAARAFRNTESGARVAPRAALRGTIQGPNGKALAMPDDLSPAGISIASDEEVAEPVEECGFCRTEVHPGAMVCPRCNAEKGIGRVGKLGVVGEGAVTTMRIITVTGWLFVLGAFLVGGMAGGLYAFFIGALMLAITLFNWRVIFWDGSYRWYRRGA